MKNDLTFKNYNDLTNAIFKYGVEYYYLIKNNKKYIIDVPEISTDFKNPNYIIDIYTIIINNKTFFIYKYSIPNKKGSYDLYKCEFSDFIKYMENL